MGSREARAADGTTAAPAAKRGRLNDRQWHDVRRAARLAREEGVTLSVHGVQISAPKVQKKLTPCSLGQKQQAGCKQRAAASAATSEPAAQPQPSRRQQRSAQRLLEFQVHKRKLLLASSGRVQTFLRQFRWQRMQLVWSSWMQAEAASPTASQPMEA
jgi:hypothetical protein